MAMRWEVKIEGDTIGFGSFSEAYEFYTENFEEAEFPVEVEDKCCKWCENNECVLRGGIADDDTCDGSIEEQEECGYVTTEKKIRPENIVARGDMFILGEYVLAPQQNAFNKLKSYWISKKLCTISVYAFTPETKEELSIKNIANSFNGYITMFEETLERLSKE